MSKIIKMTKIKFLALRFLNTLVVTRKIELWLIKYKIALSILANKALEIFC